MLFFGKWKEGYLTQSMEGYVKAKQILQANNIDYRAEVKNSDTRTATLPRNVMLPTDTNPSNLYYLYVKKDNVDLARHLLKSI